MQIYLLLLCSLFFTEALLSYLPVLYLSSSSGLNTADIFHISVYVLLQHLTRSAICANNYLHRRWIFLTDKYLIILSSRYPSCRCSLVLLPGLVGTYSVRLPLCMMSFKFGCMRCERKRKKGKTQFAKNRTKECKVTAMYSVRREVQSVSPHIFNQSTAEVGRRPKRYPPLASHSNVKTHLGLDIQRGKEHLFI